jgi:hypothetical protein
MNRKEIVRATNFRIEKVAGQDCVTAEVRIKTSVPYDSWMKTRIQETLDDKTDTKWPISLACWNDPIRSAIEQIANKILGIGEQNE